MLSSPARLLENSSISFRETTKPWDFLRYFALLLLEGRPQWIFYICIMRIIDRTNLKFIVVESGHEMVGGFFLTDFPLIQYKPYNWFNKEVGQKVRFLRHSGYRGFACFRVKKSWRNKGVGTFVFQEYFKLHPQKIYFTSSHKAINFYVRNGAEVFYPSTYTIYIRN